MRGKKVCSALVELIKDKKSKGQSIRAIADCLNVAKSTLADICGGKTHGTKLGRPLKTNPSKDRRIVLSIKRN